MQEIKRELFGLAVKSKDDDISRLKDALRVAIDIIDAQKSYHDNGGVLVVNENAVGYVKFIYGGMESYIEKAGRDE